jgi:acetyltransferase-like isoleucine patch superfamily enzyme
MLLKKILKKYLLKKNKNIIVDLNSVLNFQVINKTKNKDYPVSIFSSVCNFKYVNEGCKISEARCYGDISLGRFVTVTGPGTVINSIKEEISIGSFSSIGQNVCIVDFNHSFERITSSFINNKIFKDKVSSEVKTKGPVIIEEDVWIGSNSVITAGVKLGRGSIIGAGSIVTRDIPRYSIAYGSPAVVVSKRFNDETIKFLEDLQWWKWDVNKILKNKSLFNINTHNASVDDLNNLVRQNNKTN